MYRPSEDRRRRALPPMPALPSLTRAATRRPARTPTRSPDPRLPLPPRPRLVSPPGVATPRDERWFRAETLVRRPMGRLMSVASALFGPEAIAVQAEVIEGSSMTLPWRPAGLESAALTTSGSRAPGTHDPGASSHAWQWTDRLRRMPAFSGLGLRRPVAWVFALGHRLGSRAPGSGLFGRVRLGTLGALGRARAGVMGVLAPGSRLLIGLGVAFVVSALTAAVIVGLALSPAARGSAGPGHVAGVAGDLRRSDRRLSAGWLLHYEGSEDALVISRLPVPSEADR